QPELAGERDVAREDLPLDVPGRVVVVVVEPHLSDRDRTAALEQPPQLRRELGVVARGVVRVDSNGRRDVRPPRGEPHREARLLEAAHADAHDPADALAPRAAQELVWA